MQDRIDPWLEDSASYKTHGKAEKYGQYIFGKMLFDIMELRYANKL